MFGTPISEFFFSLIKHDWLRNTGMSRNYTGLYVEAFIKANYASVRTKSCFNTMTEEKTSSHNTAQNECVKGSLLQKLIPISI